ncbi:TPA: hypothetical protein N0F65_007884 [Lagenidium giganteum]|uniref:Uncharacterized protein n=1 Tax=Lagenidium giganteum TaxID=4803 RepID=A0AAV2Z3B3_9STRA|nr:TPA: hypothetical protein N0F65_007884 [Lagenidium giganteum]
MPPSRWPRSPHAGVTQAPWHVRKWKRIRKDGSILWNRKGNGWFLSSTRNHGFDEALHHHGDVAKRQ